MPLARDVHKEVRKIEIFALETNNKRHKKDWTCDVDLLQQREKLKITNSSSGHAQLSNLQHTKTHLQVSKCN